MRTKLPEALRQKMQVTRTTNIIYGAIALAFASYSCAATSTSERAGLLGNLFMCLLAGVVTASIVFIRSIIRLHWTAMVHRPKGWVLWTSPKSDTKAIATPRVYVNFSETSIRLCKHIDNVRLQSGAPPFTQIRITGGPNFAAYSYGEDRILEVGLFALAAMDEREFSASVAHEAGHMLEHKVLERHETQVHTWTFYDFLQEHRNDRKLYWATVDEVNKEGRSYSPGESAAFGFLGRIIRRWAHDKALRWAENIFFSEAIELAERYARTDIDGNELRACEFACDRTAANCVGADALAGALVRHASITMAYKRFYLHDYIAGEHRKSFPARINCALDAVETYSKSASPGITKLREVLLSQETATHPSTTDRVRAITGHDSLEIPSARPLISRGELIEMWEWLSENMRGLNDIEDALAQRGTWDFALNLRGCYPEDLERQLIDCDPELIWELPHSGRILQSDSPSGTTNARYSKSSNPAD